MRLVDIDFRDRDAGIRARIEFTYVPMEDEPRKWLTVMSLKKTDQEASFVFRINAAESYFQVYFGDGQSTRGNTRISTAGFAGKRCVLEYSRTRDFTFASLVSGGKKEVRLVLHRGAKAIKVEAKYYEEGQPENGLVIHRADFENVPSGAISLSAVESELSTDVRIRKDENYVGALNSIGMEYFSAKGYSRALDAFKASYQLNPSRINHHALAKVTSCINNMYGAKDRTAAWADFSAPSDIKFNNARVAFLDDDATRSVDLFVDAVDCVLGRSPYRYSDQHKKRLLSAYLMLLNGPEGGSPLRRPEVKSVRKIIASGTGWSGSGAIFDFLQEFEGVVAIRGESPYIEGVESLREIYACLDDDEQLGRRIIEFFFYVLLGHGVFRSSGDFKLFKYARSKLRSKEPNSYLNAIEEWCALAWEVRTVAGPARRELFTLLSEHTVNRFSIGREILPHEVALLDNVVHVENVDKCVQFLNNTSVLCTFRDPRSNYVALVREASYFSSSAEAYVKQRRRHIDNATRAAESAVASSRDKRDTTVEIIRFEEFVLSKSFRDALAKRLGLGFCGQKVFSHFKPWESTRNVFLHEEHPDQEEIQLIATELPEYCCDILIQPLGESRK